MHEASQQDDGWPWQPRLEGARLLLRPLVEADVEPLAAAAADPAIWALHPEPDRWQRPIFERFFRSGIDSRGALLVLERATGAVLGSSRFTRHDPAARSVEIGYTFLVTRCWGTGLNRELKGLMLAHAFRHVDRVEFVVGERNLRSRRAMEKLGGVPLREEEKTTWRGARVRSVVYGIERAAWRG
ncbi:MAG: GNAT family N-acetyltransferase [Anaeromyxobacter sp.]